MTDIRNERGDITTDPTENEKIGTIKSTVWELGVLVAAGLVILSS